MSRLTGFVNVPGDFGGLVLYLGFWGLEIWKKKREKKGEKRKRQQGRQSTLPTGG